MPMTKRKSSSFSWSDPAVIELRFPVSFPTCAQAARSASKSSWAECTRSDYRRILAILDSALARSLVKTKSSSINVWRSHKRHLARCNTSNPPSEAYKPTRLIKTMDVRWNHTMLLTPGRLTRRHIYKVTIGVVLASNRQDRYDNTIRRRVQALGIKCLSSRCNSIIKTAQQKNQTWIEHW